MAAWFGSKKRDKDVDEFPNKESGNHDEASQEENSLITITDAAKQKINELIQGAEAPVPGIRVLAEATSPMNPQYSLAFVQEDEDFDDDTVFDYDDFKLFIDSESLPFMENVKLDFITSGMGGGFRIDKVRTAAKIEGPLAEKVQKVIEEQINPALALHGGFIELINVEGSTAYIELGGGCRGCGMVDVTLKQGVEVMIKQNVPEITEILDTTDHASGNNPYYQPSK